MRIRFVVSGEVFRTAYEAFREAAREIEERMRSALTEDYGMTEFTFLAIILPDELLGLYPEVVKYTSRTRIGECRLRVELAAFEGADPRGHRELLCAALAAALMKLPAAGGPATGCARLLDDFVREAKAADWLRVKPAKGETRGRRKPRS